MFSNDFEKEMLSAARFGGSRTAFRFSWSFSRERLFRRCRRAFFIDCFLSQGGWDPSAHPLIRSAYVEKQRLPFPLWLSRTVRAGLREGLKKALAQPPDARRKAFSSGFLRFLSGKLFDLEFSMSRKEYLDDPKRPCLRECVEGEKIPFSALRPQAVSAFGTAHGLLTGSPLFQELLSLDVMNFRFGEDLISLPFDPCPVWFAPGLIFFLSNKFHMLLPSASGAEDETPGFPPAAAVSAALFDLHIRSKWKSEEPTVTHLFRFGPDAAGMEEIPPASGLPDRIRSGAGEMFSLIRPDGSVFFGDFPKTGEPGGCASCRYAGTCRMLDEWALHHC